MKKRLFCLLLVVTCLFGCSFETYTSDNDDNSSIEGGNGKNPANNVVLNETTGNKCDTVPTTYQEFDGDSSNIEDVYERVVKSTVTVLSYTDQYVGIATGSGVVFSQTEDEEYVFIYTNAHVVNNATSISGLQRKTYIAAKFEIVYYNGTRVTATLVAKDPSEDVAVLKAACEPECDFSIATIGDSSKLNIGQTIITVGSPLGIDYTNTLTSGVVSGVNVIMDTDNDEDGEDTTMFLIQIDAALSSGNSGGPLFNLDGEVVGINTLKIVEDGNSVAESFNFSIPINHVKLVTSTIIEKGSYSRPLIGVSVSDIFRLSLYEREENEITYSKGLYIISISEDGACYGLFDEERIITKINDVEIFKTSDFFVELYSFLPGESISITTTDKTGANPLEVSVTLK